LDATDALAVALCHYFQTSRIEKPTAIKAKGKSAKANKGWNAFVNNNPDRLI
jgi:crossover junction endodeoxyribonuclease RuvC